MHDSSLVSSIQSVQLVQLVQLVLLAQFGVAGLRLISEKLAIPHLLLYR